MDVKRQVQGMSKIAKVNLDRVFALNVALGLVANFNGILMTRPGARFAAEDLEQNKIEYNAIGRELPRTGPRGMVRPRASRSTASRCPSTSKGAFSRAISTTRSWRPCEKNSRSKSELLSFSLATP